MQHSTEGRPSWKEFSKLMFCLNFSTIDASEWIISGLPLTITVCWILNYLMSTSILKQEFIWGGIQIGLIIILCWVCMLKQSFLLSHMQERSSLNPNWGTWTLYSRLSLSTIVDNASMSFKMILSFYKDKCWWGIFLWYSSQTGETGTQMSF